MELLRLLYRSELKDFVDWAIDLLVTQLYNSDEDVVEKTYEVLEEINQNDHIMKKVIERCPNYNLKTKSKFLIQLLRISVGFNYLTDIKNQTENEIESWF